MSTAKIITETIEHHSECPGCANSCNKFLLIRSWQTMKLPMTILWRDASNPVAPFWKSRRVNALVMPSLSSRPVTSLGHQEGRRVFREGLKFFELCPIFWNYAQHIFSGRRAKNFLGADLPRLITGLLSSNPGHSDQGTLKLRYGSKVCIVYLPQIPLSKTVISSL